MRLRFSILFSCLLATWSFTVAQPVPPGGPPVVITEIMYHSPATGEDSLEFIELKNPSATNARNLTGYSFIAGVEFTFHVGTIVQPHEYILIAKDSVAFENTFGVPAFQWTSGDLSNAGEAIIIQNNINGVVDSLVYGVSAPWPSEANGSGSSLTLCNDTLDNAMVSTWSATTTNTGIMVSRIAIHATPGQACSIDNSVTDLHQTSIRLYPNPNNGQFELTWSDLQGAHKLSITDVSGRVIWSNTVDLSQNGQLSLDLELRSGVYILHLAQQQVSSARKRFIVE